MDETERGQGSLVDAAGRLAPQLRASVAEDDALRRLSDSTWKELMEGGLLRALQPARWGGGEVRLLEFVDATIEVARAAPSAGWVAGVIGVHPWQLALFEDAAQQEMWGEDPTAMHSSSYNPTGRAERAPGGFRLEGRWSFSSGCDHCKGVVLGAIAGSREVGGSEVPELRSFLLLADQYRIDDNWHVAGLKGTGSKDIVVDGAFVPEHRTQSHLDYSLDLPLPGQERNDGPLYRLPWSAVFNVALVAAVLGSARGFVETWIEQTRERRLPGRGSAAEDALMQQRLAEAVWALDATTTQVRADLAELWEMAEARTTVTMQQRTRVRWNMIRGCELVGRATSELFRAASGRSIYLDHPLQSRFQDVHAALAHAFLLPDPVARSVGGTLLGAASSQIMP